MHQEQQQQRKRKWVCQYNSEYTPEELKEEIEQFETKTGRNHFRPLAKECVGVLLEEATQTLYLFLKNQLSQKVLEKYPFILKNTLKEWKTRRISFQACIQDHSDLLSYVFENPSKLNSKILHKQSARNMEGQVGYQRILGNFMNEIASTGRRYEELLNEAIEKQAGLRQLILFENKQLLLDYFEEVKIISSGMMLIERSEGGGGGVEEQKEKENKERESEDASKTSIHKAKGSNEEEDLDIPSPASIASL